MGVTGVRKPGSFYLFERKPIVRKDKYDTWREVASLLGFKTPNTMFRALLTNLKHLTMNGNGKPPLCRKTG
jgi:hypothetical protein